MNPNVIWKYPINLKQAAAFGGQHVVVPENWRPLDAQIQAGQLVLWAIVNPDLPETTARVFVSGTGHQAAGKYLSTVQDGAFVWHIFTDRKAS